MSMKPDFPSRRRQQFMSEARVTEARATLNTAAEFFARNPLGSGSTDQERDMLARLTSAEHRLDLLLLDFTAGESVDGLRGKLESAIAAYEAYAKLLWAQAGDRNEVAFKFGAIDDYCALLQLVGLCFLLHRRDLLPRIAALQDGLDAVGQKGQGNGGTDWVFEEFMSFATGPESRYESETICCSRPYEALADALSSENNVTALKDLDRFLKHWYKDLAGTGWHDSHKPDEQGRQGGYYGYWSFEAGAAVLLLGIEDDSILQKYLYYPKDMVAWAREHAALSNPDEKAAARLRTLAGEPCPREGFWLTPARVGSRRRFTQGEVMPAVGGDYGATIWQWDDRQ